MARPLTRRCVPPWRKHMAGSALPLAVRGVRSLASWRGFWSTPGPASYHRCCTDTRQIVTCRQHFGDSPVVPATPRLECSWTTSTPSSNWRSLLGTSWLSRARESARSPAFPITVGPGGVWEKNTPPTIGDFRENLETRAAYWRERKDRYPGCGIRCRTVGTWPWFVAGRRIAQCCHHPEHRWFAPEVGH
jgi:hypothetical protein